MLRDSSPISPSRRRRTESGDGSDAESSHLTYSPLSSAPSSPAHTDSQPPPPYSSPSTQRSGASGATYDGSKYSSLMQYLNSELGEGDDDSMRPGEGAFDDELSSMSLSPNGKGRGRGTEARGGAPSSSYLSATAQTFLANNKSSSGAGTGAASSPSRSVGAQSRGGRSYVWDEWQYDDRHGSIVSQLTGDDGDDGNGSSAQGGDNATYFSLRAGAGATSPSPSSSSSPQRTLGSHASKSVQHVVEELKVKIDAMKGQLQQKQARIKDLQSELARLHTAKTRREQKFKTTWASKLSEQREVQAATLKKSRDFVERISGDVKQLTIKRDGLKDKVARLAAHRESALQLLQEDAQRKAQRVRRQWEAEERSVFEKVLKGKEEALKKAAAESFGPALDKMVIEGKEAVRARQDEVTKRLEKLRRELALEVQDKLTQAREELRDQIRDDDEKSRRVAERKLQDLLRKHGEELDALKLKFQREKKMAEESAERTRRIDAETSLEGMREIRKSESQQVVEIMAAQQRELGQLVTNHGEAISALKASLAKEEEAFARRLRKELAAASEQNRDRAVSSLTARINAEADKVISKLREDIAAERKVVRDRIESELDDLRVSAQHRLDSMQMSENRAVERVASLRGEIESLRRELSSLEQEQASKTPDVSAVRKDLSTMRQELASVKEEGEALEHRFGEDRAQRRLKLAREDERVKAAVAAAEEALARQEVQHANRREDARAMYATDLTRIRDKVASLLNKKDATARDLRQQLGALQQRTAQLEGELDEKRLKQAMETPGTLEEAFKRVGVPPRSGRK